MTTINNLIEQVGGIDKAMEIVNGAPDGFNAYSFKEKKYVQSVWFLGEVLLNDLRTAIAQHDEGQNVMDKPKTYNEWHSSLKDFEGLRHANCCKISYEAGQQSRQAEVDQAYADIETFAQAFERECEFKTQFAQDLKEKDKRIEEALRLIISWDDQSYRDDADQLINDLDDVLRGEHE